MESSAVQVQHVVTEETTTLVPEVQTLEGRVESSAPQMQHAVAEETTSSGAPTDSAHNKPAKAGDASHAEQGGAEEVTEKAEDIWTVFLEEVKFSTTDDGKPATSEPSAESTTRDETPTGHNAPAESSQLSTDHDLPTDVPAVQTETDLQQSSQTGPVPDTQTDSPATLTVTDRRPLQTTGSDPTASGQ